MNHEVPAVDQPVDRPTTDARRGSAVRGALAGVAVILILAAVLVGVRAAGRDSTGTPSAAPGAHPPADGATPDTAAPRTPPADTATGEAARSAAATPATPGPVPPDAPAPAANQGGTPPATVSTPAALAQRPTVQGGRAGKLTKLSVTTLVRGGGPRVRAGQLVVVNYVLARYRTGEEIDASWDAGRPLPPFRVGSGAVIPGFDRGLVGVPVGSRVRLDVPARLAYGDPAPPGRPSGDLRFIVDVLAAR
jgi:peptidylprolyl isomerase